MKRTFVPIAISAVLLAGAAGAATPAANGSLVKGLDGDVYLPYKPSVVRETQEKLESHGLYSGAIDGVLDHDTMRATAEFQKQNGLHVSGVPTPSTRRALERG